MSMTEIRIHGRGGQGAVVASQILALTAMKEGKYVQSFPEFGVERRGATVEAFVRIADKKINERCKIYHPHYVVVMDPALVNIVDVTEGIRENGWVLINTSKTPKDFSFHANVATIDAFSIATEKKLGSHGHPIVNTTILGALVKIAPVVNIKTLVEAIRESISSNTEKNVEAALAAHDKVKI